MATEPANTGVPPRATPTHDLTAFARCCLAHCPDPDTLEQIGKIFFDTAADLRGRISTEAGNA